MQLVYKTHALLLAMRTRRRVSNCHDTVGKLTVAIMEEFTKEDDQNISEIQDVSSHLKRRLSDRRRSSVIERRLRLSHCEATLETISQSPPSILRSYSRPLDRFRYISWLFGRTYFVWKELGLQSKAKLNARYEELVTKARSDPKSKLIAGPKLITEPERASLNKQLSERTSEDDEILRHLIESKDVFKKFFGIGTDLLSKLVYLESFEKGSVIVHQGDLGIGFYYILSGLVCVATHTEKEKEDNPVKQPADKQPVDDNKPIKWEDEYQISFNGYIKPGGSFGELALLLKGERKATIVCVHDTEVIRINQDDLEKLLQANRRVEWIVKTDCFQKHFLFRGWSVDNISDAIRHSHIRKYNQNTVILDNLCNNTDYVHVIISGSCKVAYEVKMYEEVLNNGFVKLSLLSNQGTTTKSSKRKKIIKKFWHVGNLLPDDYFGVGEGTENTYIIADAKTECLLVSSIAFQKHNRGKLFEEMKQKKINDYPQPKDFMDSYKRQREWAIYKQEVVEEVLRRKYDQKNLLVWRSCDYNMTYSHKRF